MFIVVCQKIFKMFSCSPRGILYFLFYFGGHASKLLICKKSGVVLLLTASFVAVISNKINDFLGL